MNSKINFNGYSTFLFDLDATLLPFSQPELTKAFFTSIYEFGRENGCSDVFPAAFDHGFNNMKINDGSMINTEAFKKGFLYEYPDFPYDIDEFFDRFYNTKFKDAEKVVNYRGTEKELLNNLRKNGFMLVCATNPVFPISATRVRMEWGGIAPEDFDYITLHTNSSYCKPSVLYFNELLEKLGKKADECMMVGNDTLDDLGAVNAGIKTVLISDYLLDKGYSSLDRASVVTYAEFRKAAFNAEKKK